MWPRSSNSSGIDQSTDAEKGPNQSQKKFPRETDKKPTFACPGAVSMDVLPRELAEELEADEANQSPQGTGFTSFISRVMSKSSVKSEPGPPPDGGLKAWTMVFCSHLVAMNTWGFINSFGVFQTYYTTALDRSPSSVSWIGSNQVFLLFFIGTFSGRLTDAGYFRQVFLVGTAFQIVGIFTLAHATHYWQIFLAQGVCLGLGNGCLFCSSIAIISTYFSKRRSLALGVSACGSATGGLVFPSMARQLLPSAGFPCTVRAIGFIQLATLIIANIFMKSRTRPRPAGPWVDWAAFRELEYTFFACGIFFCFWGVYFAFYYIASFTDEIISLDYTSSLSLLLVLNAVGVIGRLLPGHVADRIGVLNVMVPNAAVAGICMLCWMAVKRVAGLYVWVIFYGTVAGGIQSLFAAGLSSLTTDMRKMGVRIGMTFTTVSFATLTGPPIAGAFIQAGGGKYSGAQGFAGAALFVGTGFLCAARVVKGRKVGVKGERWWEAKV